MDVETRLEEVLEEVRESNRYELLTRLLCRMPNGHFKENFLRDFQKRNYWIKDEYEECGCFDGETVYRKG